MSLWLSALLVVRGDETSLSRSMKSPVTAIVTRRFSADPEHVFDSRLDPGGIASRQGITASRSTCLSETVSGPILAEEVGERGGGSGRDFLRAFERATAAEDRSRRPGGLAVRWCRTTRRMKLSTPAHDAGGRWHTGHRIAAPRTRHAARRRSSEFQ